MQYSRKRIQNNDRGDDPGSWKQNGENARNVYQSPRRTKEQTEMNNTLEGITEAGKWISGPRWQWEWISDLEDRMVEITSQTEYRLKEKKKEDSLRDLWDNVKHINISIIRIPEGEEREKGSKKIFKEIIAENFPNMGKEIVNWVLEVQRVLSRINQRRNTLRHIVIKLTKIRDKDKILKATREKWQITHKGTLFRLYQLIS